jgi:PAS domain-containing protein
MRTINGDHLPSYGENLREAAFADAPHGYLLIDPELIILDVNQRYLDLTATCRSDLVGKALFEAFPDNPASLLADGVRNLRLSLETVLKTRRPHAMAVQKYDIPIRDSADGRFEERFWRPLNSPVLREGQIIAMIHHVENVTDETITQRDQLDLSRFDAAPLIAFTACMDVYGPRLIATVCLALDRRSRLLMYIRLLRAA